MTQNYLVFCINNNVKFVDGSIPSGKITANSINKNSIFTISPFAEDTIIKAVFQPKDRAIEPMTVWTVPTDKVKPQDLINPNKSYYELVKDWYVREVKIPSLVLEYISSARNTEIGITFFAQQRVLPQVPQSLTFDGYLEQSTPSISVGTYKIVKPAEMIWNDLALNFNDVVYNANGTYQVINAIRFADNTSTILYGVDPAILNDNFEYVDPTTTDLILEKLGELEADIRILNLEAIKTINGAETQTAFTSVTASGNTRTISTHVKIDADPNNILEDNVRGLLVDKNKVVEVIDESIDSGDIREKIVDIVEEDINPYVNVQQLANKNVEMTKQGGEKVTLTFPFEDIEDELERLETAKLDKNFTALVEQTVTNLSDELVINRGGVAYKAKLSDLLSHVAVTDLFEIVTFLPVTGLPNKIYLLIKGASEQDNVYDEYIWVDNDWEKIGSISIDLSNYYNKTEIDALLLAKQDKLINQTNIKSINGVSILGSGNIDVGNAAMEVFNLAIAPADFTGVVATKIVPNLNTASKFMFVSNDKYSLVETEVRQNAINFDNAEFIAQCLANGTITLTVNDVPNTTIYASVWIFSTQSDFDEFVEKSGLINVVYINDTNGNQIVKPIDDFLMKQKGVTTYPQVYFKQADGTQSMRDFSALAIGNAIVQRNALGQIEGVDATSSTQLATKGQMDIGLETKQPLLGFTAENVTNKTTALNASSTNVQYAGAKATYDLVQTKQAILTNVTSAEIVTGTDTTQKSVTAKALNEAINLIMFNSLGGSS